MEIGICDLEKTVVYEDNQSLIPIAPKNGYQSRAKHINIRYHFIREQVQQVIVEIQYIESKDQLADFSTKVILTKQFQQLVKKPNVRNSMSRGSVAMASENPTIPNGFL